MNNRDFVKKYNLTYAYVAQIHLHNQTVHNLLKGTDPEKWCIENVLLTMKFKVSLKCVPFLRLSNQILFPLSLSLMSLTLLLHSRLCFPSIPKRSPVVACSRKTQAWVQELQVPLPWTASLKQNIQGGGRCFFKLPSSSKHCNCPPFPRKK